VKIFIAARSTKAEASLSPSSSSQGDRGDGGNGGHVSVEASVDGEGAEEETAEAASFLAFPARVRL